VLRSGGMRLLAVGGSVSMPRCRPNEPWARREPSIIPCVALALGRSCSGWRPGGPPSISPGRSTSGLRQFTASPSWESSSARWSSCAGPCSRTVALVPRYLNLSDLSSGTTCLRSSNSAIPLLTAVFVSGGRSAETASTLRDGGAPRLRDDPLRLLGRGGSPTADARTAAAGKAFVIFALVLPLVTTREGAQAGAWALQSRAGSCWRGSPLQVVTGDFGSDFGGSVVRARQHLRRGHEAQISGRWAIRFLRSDPAARLSRGLLLGLKSGAVPCASPWRLRLR
jgi:hypothetical protein